MSLKPATISIMQTWHTSSVNHFILDDRSWNIYIQLSMAWSSVLGFDAQRKTIHFSEETTGRARTRNAG